jgi:hypothetical protein
MYSATNDCLRNNCSHICLLSSTNPEGYRCACPSGFELDENLRECKGTLYVKCIVHVISFIMNSAQLGLLFTLQSSYVRRIDLDGTSSSSVTLFTGGNPIAVDYDYRFDVHDISIAASCQYIILVHTCLCSVIEFLLSICALIIVL